METAVKTREVAERNQERPWLASYPPGIPSTIAYPNVTMGTLFDQLAPRYPTTEALVFEGYGLSWRELQSLVERMATSFHHLGIRKGDRVMLLLPNVPHFVIAYYALLKLGAIVAPTYPLYAERELDAQIREITPKIIVTLDVLYEKVAAIWRPGGVQYIVVGTLLDFMPSWVRVSAGALALAQQQPAGTARGRFVDRMLRLLGTRIPVVQRLRDIPRPAQPVPPLPDILSFRSLLGRVDPLPPAEVSPDEVAVLLRTGGTTGTPKAVMLTHRNLVVNSYQMRNYFPGLEDGKETMLAVAPFFHAFGLTLVLNDGLLLGARLVLLPRAVLGDILRAIDRYHASVFLGAPAHFAAMADSERLDRYDLRSLRLCVSGAASLPLEVKERFERRTGAHIHQGYGLTEASPATHGMPYDGSGPPGSIGLPFADTDARIVDETGKPVPAGVRGELLIRGPQVMLGYWQRPAETEAALQGGWLHTGDIASMDEKGFFTIVDRKKDVIIVGGEKVYPNEIEDVLRQHPKVDDAAVVGVPDPRWGEEVYAFVVLKAGETTTPAEVTGWLRERVARYKVPRSVELRTELPRSHLGKVLRHQLLAEKASQSR